MSDDDLYVSKSVEIEAMQWEVTNNPVEGWDAESIIVWVNDNGGEARYEPPTPRSMYWRECGARIMVRTNSTGIQPSTWALVAPGWWVIKGSEWFEYDTSDGNHRVLDHYPCDPDTFEKRWERKHGQ